MFVLTFIWKEMAGKVYSNWGVYISDCVLEPHNVNKQRHNEMLLKWLCQRCCVCPHTNVTTSVEAQGSIDKVIEISKIKIFIYSFIFPKLESTDNNHFTTTKKIKEQANNYQFQQFSTQSVYINRLFLLSLISYISLAALMSA